MIAVLDSSAALEVVLKRPGAKPITEHLLNADWVISPTLFVSEVANAFWKYHRLAHLPLDLCEKCMDRAIALPDDFTNETDLYREAFAMACSTNHPVYNCMYLVLTRRNNGVLLTMDRKLRNLATVLNIKCLKAEKTS